MALYDREGKLKSESGAKIENIFLLYLSNKR